MRYTKQERKQIKIARKARDNKRSGINSVAFCAEGRLISEKSLRIQNNIR